MGQANQRSTLQGSAASAPWLAASTMPQSSQLRASGPSLSMLHVSAMHPAREIRPKVGLSPVVPQRRAGEMMLPSVSLPIANGTSPAATADAEPADEPLDP